MAVEVIRGKAKQIAVAAAYVQGLERDRARLGEVEASLQHTIWEVTQLSGYNRALYQILKEIVESHEQGQVYRLEKVLRTGGDVLDANRPIFEDVWQCPSGHSKYDHDDNGCEFLVCKPIC